MCNIVEPDFEQVTNTGKTTVVVNSHIDGKKFTLVDYIDVYAKEKTKKNHHSIDITDELVDRGINTNGFMIILDITKDNKISHIEIIPSKFFTRA